MLVLICEDERPLSALMKEVLEGEGIEVLQAFTMTEAKNLLAANPEIGAVSMDGQMPPNAGEGVAFTDALVEHIHDRRPDLKGKVFVLAGHTTYRDLILRVGGVGIPGPNPGEELGAVKPFRIPVIQALAKACKDRVALSL